MGRSCELSLLVHGGTSVPVSARVAGVTLLDGDRGFQVKTLPVLGPVAVTLSGAILPLGGVAEGP